MIINISALKAKFLPRRTGSGNEKPFKEMDILDHIEKIVEVVHKDGINKGQITSRRHIDYVTGKLGISPLQAVLFSLFIEKSDDNHIQISEIAESTKCSKVRLIKLRSDCEELEKKRLIRCSRDDDSITYRIPREVSESLRKHDEYIPEKIENLSLFKFFTFLERIFDERSNNELNFEMMQLELLDLVNQNMHLPFCKKIMSYNLSNSDLVLLLCFCHLSGNNNDDHIMSHDIGFIYDNKFLFSEIKQNLSDGSHILMEAKFVEFTNNDGFVNSDSWKLSDMAKNELMADFKENRNYKKGLILSETIKPKLMFYNPEEEEAIKTLVSLLHEENYRKIQDRLDSKGMRKGFACLFSGGPGTGKTETAWQIARETKRNIMMVDISETKSMWYGESEKKIKEIFDTYRSAVKNSSIAPILLFNEADAVIGKRKEFNSASRAVDQTENTIQNIILQEMENLSGIMIATTNLTQNMDSAFERRFLYKITFEKPSLESRMGIWKSMLPGLAEESVRDLSSRFELSGGQIENIARKTEVDDIINGSALSMDILIRYCKAETLQDTNTSKKIGFAHE